MVNEVLVPYTIVPKRVPLILFPYNCDADVYAVVSP